MPNLNVSIPHQLPRPEARRRVEQLIGQLRQQYGSIIGSLDERWEGDTLHFAAASSGLSVTGKVFVEDQSVRLDVELPWALAMMTGSVRKTLEQEGQKLLKA